MGTKYKRKTTTSQCCVDEIPSLYFVGIDCDIPSNLADVTKQILTIHAKNGDLGWLADVLYEIEIEMTTTA